MTENKIKKTCPECTHSECTLHGAVVASKEIEGKTIQRSYNLFKCLNCKRKFLVDRTDNPAEQELTEKVIKSSKIILK